MRKNVNTRADGRIFTRTAAHSKAINLGAIIFRGGTRL